CNTFTLSCRSCLLCAYWWESPELVGPHYRERTIGEHGCACSRQEPGARCPEGYRAPGFPATSPGWLPETPPTYHRLAPSGPRTSESSHLRGVGPLVPEAQ